MINFRKRIEESVGLDVGSYSIKVVSLRKEDGEDVLAACNIKQIPRELSEQQIGGVIKEALEEIELFPDSVNLSISGPDVIVRFIDLPKMTKEQLGNALSFEAEKYIPFNINEVVLDFIILGEGAEPGQMRVLLAAAKREPIVFIVKTIEDLGMTVNCIDIDSFAMFNTFIETESSPEEEGKAFIVLGHSRADVLITTGTMPCFMRQIQIGGKDMDSAICKTLAVSEDKIEEFKINADRETQEKIKQAIVPVLDDLLRELQLSFGYFENRHNMEIKKIYCAGGLVYQDGVVPYLSEKLGISLDLWDPIAKMRTMEHISKEDIAKVASQLVVGVGLALRG